MPLETSILAGNVPESVSLKINGLTTHADLLHGQKTGIFLDQRENCRAAAKYAHGGKALDSLPVPVWDILIDYEKTVSRLRGDCLRVIGAGKSGRGDYRQNS